MWGWRELSLTAAGVGWGLPVPGGLSPCLRRLRGCEQLAELGASPLSSRDQPSGLRVQGGPLGRGAPQLPRCGGFWPQFSPTWTLHYPPTPPAHALLPLPGPVQPESSRVSRGLVCSCESVLVPGPGCSEAEEGGRGGSVAQTSARSSQGPGRQPWWGCTWGSAHLPSQSPGLSHAAEGGRALHPQPLWFGPEQRASGSASGLPGAVGTPRPWA